MPVVYFPVHVQHLPNGHLVHRTWKYRGETLKHAQWIRAHSQHSAVVWWSFSYKSSAPCHSLTWGNPWSFFIPGPIKLTQVVVIVSHLNSLQHPIFFLDELQNSLIHHGGEWDFWRLVSHLDVQEICLAIGMDFCIMTEHQPCHSIL